jgi:hypothetical protein
LLPGTPLDICEAEAEISLDDPAIDPAADVRDEVAFAALAPFPATDTALPNDKAVKAAAPIVFAIEDALSVPIEPGLNPDNALASSHRINLAAATSTTVSTEKIIALVVEAARVGLRPALKPVLKACALDIVWK